jgi:hypothetical protein
VKSGTYTFLATRRVHFLETIARDFGDREEDALAILTEAY